MSNFIFPDAKEAFLGAEIDFDADDIVVVLIDATWVPDTADSNISDATGGSIVATSAPLTSKTRVAGVFDAANPTFTALTGDPVRGYLTVHDSTGLLISWTDTNQNTTPINVTPDGTDFTIRFSASGIFQL